MTITMISDRCLWGSSRSGAARFRAAQFRAAQYRAERGAPSAARKRWARDRDQTKPVYGVVKYV